MQQAIQLLYKSSTCGNIVATKIKGNYTSEAAKLHVDVWFNYNYRYKRSCLLMCIILVSSSKQYETCLAYWYIAQQ